MKIRKNILIKIAAISFLLTIFWSASAHAQPQVTGFSGSLINGSPITITGLGFGTNGPTILVFDDFEGSTNGSNIKTGAGSATIGEWTSVTYINNTPPKYSNAHSLSGSLAFRGDATANSGDNNGSGTTAFKMGFTTSDIFVSYWYYFPTTSDWPCLNGGNCNNKLVWVTGSGTGDDDRVIPTNLPSGKSGANNTFYPACNDCVGGEPQFYPTLTMSKGKWYRFWVYLHGVGNATDHEELWVASPSSEANIAAATRINRTTQIWNADFNGFNRVMINGFNRWCNDCAESAPTFDDVYVSIGAGARARVEIGDAATYATSKNLAIATVTSWSDTSISVTIRQGSFSNLNNAYLYVIDADGNVNENGYPLSNGGGNTPPPSSGSGGDSSASGGSGCGFIKDNGKGQGAKGEGISMMILLFLLLILFKIKKANQCKWQRAGIAKTTLFITATVLMFLLFAGISHAADYYVSPTGASAWANCSGSTPLNETSSCSPSTAMTNVTAGDTVYFRGGNYYPPDVGIDGSFPSWYPRASGTSANPIILKAYPGETVTIYQPADGKAAIGSALHNYIIWDGFILVKTTTTVANGVYRCYLGDNNTIRNSEFIGNVASNSQNQVGVYINDCTNTYIYNNIFRNFTGSVNTGAMWLMEDSNAYVFNNDFYDSDNGVQTKSAFSGIYAYNNFFRGVGKPFHWQQQNPAVHDFYIHNNVAVIPSGGFFLFAFDPSNEYNNTQVYNNTIYCSAGCIAVYLGNSNTRTAIFWNNIVFGASETTMFARLTSGAGIPDYMDYNNYFTSGTANWRLDSTTYNTINSWRTAASFDTNSITSDPLFVNAGGASPADYKLQSSSPARTSGRGGSYATVMGAYITGNETIGYDPDAPRVEITSPPNSTVTTTNTSITLSGTATDTVGIVSVTWSNDRGGSGTAWSGSATGTVNWTVSNIPLQSGQNIITVTATDGDNKTGIDAITVTVSSGSGSTPPPSSSSGGDSGGGSSGGSGCGFIKDNGKEQGAKGEGVALMILLIITLAGIAIVRKMAINKGSKGVEHIKRMIYFSSFFFVIFCIPVLANAATYYVATNGNDANPGTEVLPWKTIQKAADTMVAGDTVLIKEGTYFKEGTGPSPDQDAGGIQPKNSGSLGSSITFKAYPGHKVIIDQNYESMGFNIQGGKNYITIDGFEIRRATIAGIRTDDAPKHQGLVIQNNIITLMQSGMNFAGIRPDGASGALIRNNYIYNLNSADGILTYDLHNSIVENNEIWNVGNGIYYKRQYNDQGNITRYNYIHDITKIGIRFNSTSPPTYACTNHTVHNNIISKAPKAISMWECDDGVSQNSKFYNNTIIDSPTGFYMVAGGTTNIETTQIWNNIIYNTVDGGIQWDTVLMIVDKPSFISLSNYNNFYETTQYLPISWNKSNYTVSGYQSASGLDVNSLSVDPMFVDKTNQNFRLQSSSPLKGKGLGGVDIGAYATGNEVIGPTDGGTGGDNTPPPSSGSGGDSGGGSGGSGCGFVKDDGKGLKAKGEGLSLMIMLIIALAGISLAKRVSDISIK